MPVAAGSCSNCARPATRCAIESSWAGTPSRPPSSGTRWPGSVHRHLTPDGMGEGRLGRSRPSPPIHDELGRSQPEASLQEVQPVAGRVVVVTGASAGIGRAVACAFGAKGDRVGLLARGEAGLDGAVKDIERAGGQALAVPTDVADYGQVEVAAEQVEQMLGPIDIWVNVAFTSVFAPFTEIRPEEFKRVTEVSYLGYVYGTRAALDRMLARDQGTIVQVGSASPIGGFRCRPPTVAPNTPSRASPRRCDASCCTSAARCGSRWCSYRRSTPPNSTGCSTGCPTVRARSHRYTSPRWPPGQSCTPRTTQGVASTGSVAAPSGRWWRTSWLPAC